MKLDLNNKIDAVIDGTQEIAENAQEATSEFHEKYVSKVIPDFGKYGNVATFAAEMLPGVSEYNAIREGDWAAFAISAGLDGAALVAGAVSLGAGYAAVKGGTTVAKTGAKVAAKEVAEAGAKTIAKETVEAGAEKAAKEAVEAGAKKVAKEVAESGVEKVAKEAIEEGTEKTAKEVVEKVTLEVGEKIDKTKFPEYLDEIGKITKREIPSQQKELIEKALAEKDFSKLSAEATNLARKEFGSCKAKLIEEWEVKTGQSWPRYTEDIINEAGNVIRRAGQPFDAHHIIELCTEGPNEWWNIHPASFPIEHQAGIHAAESLATLIFG